MEKNIAERKKGIRRTQVAEIKRVTWLGIFINLGLAAIKFVVGFLGSSHAVIADGVHSISDITTDFAVIFGVKFWSAPPDEEHPYGHWRIETLIAAAIGIALAVVAVGLGYKAIISIGEAGFRRVTWIAAIGPVISIVFKELLYRRTISVGRKAKSPAVIANAWHHRSDAISSLPALIAVIAASINPKWMFFDNIGSLIISVFILKVAWDIVRPSLEELTDRGASAEERDKIYRIATDVAGVIDAHAIRTRKLGPNLFVDLHILVDPQVSVMIGHEISENVKREIIERGPDVIDVVVHIEPFGNDPDVA